MIVYHLSVRDLGDVPVLRPRIPRDLMPFENRTIERVCVTPTIAGCVMALSGCFYNRGHWFAYSAEVPEDLLREPGKVCVPDSEATGELWLLEPLRFARFGHA